MKKTAVLISVMAGLFIFVSGFFGLARDQYSHLANFSAALASENSAAISHVSLDLQKLKADGRFPELASFLEENQASAVQTTGDTINFFNQVLENYLFLSSTFQSETLRQAGCDSRFSKSSDLTWTTLSRNQEENRLIYLNPADYSPGSTQFAFIPLENLETGYGQFCLLTKNPESISEFRNRFSEYIGSIDQNDSTFFESQTGIQGWNLAFFILYLAAELVVFYCFILNRQREIAIFRLNGCPKKQIFHEVYSAYLKMVGMAAPAAVTVLYILVLFPFAPVKLVFLVRILLPFLIFHLLVIGALAATGWLSCSWQKDFSSLKGYRSSKQVIFICSVLMLICVSWLLPKVSDSLAILVEDIHSADLLEKYKSVLNGYLSDSFWRVDSANADQTASVMKFIKAWNQFLKENGGFYEDFTYSGMIPELKEGLDMDADFVVITPGYLEEKSIRLADSAESLDLSQYPEQNLVLVPSSFKGDYTHNPFLGEYLALGLTEIRIEEGISLMPHIANNSDLSNLPIKDPIIVILQNEWPSNYGGSYRFIKYEGKETEDKIENFLQKEQMSNEIRYALTDAAWESDRLSIFISLGQEAILLAVDLIFFASLLKVSVSLFFFNKRKENGVEILYGIPAFRRWKTWIFIWSLTLIGSMVIAMILSHTLSLSLIGAFLFLALFSLAETTVIIRSLEKGNEIKMLKGGDF